MYALICSTGRYSTMLRGTFKSGPTSPPSRLMAWQATHSPRKISNPAHAGEPGGAVVGTVWMRAPEARQLDLDHLPQPRRSRRGSGRPHEAEWPRVDVLRAEGGEAQRGVGGKRGVAE